MDTTRKWAATCGVISLLPISISTLILIVLQPAILATYDYAYHGRPLPLAISNFVASPVVPWVLLAIPVSATGILLIRKRPTLESTVLLSLGNFAYTIVLLVLYAAAGVGIILTWNYGSL